MKETSEIIAERMNAVADQILKREPLHEEHSRISRLNRIAELREMWNAPRRQVNRTEIDRSGVWGYKEASIRGKLGSGFCVALIGGNGPGKTQMGVELMRVATENGKSAFYQTAVGFFLDIKASFRKDSRADEDSVIDRYARYSLLILDEIGQRGETDWEDRILFEMLNRRYNNVKDTLLISNQTQQEFTAAIGPSIASRMNETGGIIECNWPSFRDR